MWTKITIKKYLREAEDRHRLARLYADKDDFRMAAGIEGDVVEALRRALEMAEKKRLDYYSFYLERAND